MERKTKVPRQLHKLRKPCHPNMIRRLQVHVEDPQAVLNRPIMRKEPSLKHLEARKQMYFPGWYSVSPSSTQTQSCPDLHKASMAGLNRDKIWRQPSQDHRKTQVFFPKLSNQTPSSSKTELPHEAFEHVRSLQTTAKNVGSTGTLPTAASIFENEYNGLDIDPCQVEIYCEMIRIPFFANFEKWEPLYVWHFIIRTIKFYKARNALKAKLCLANEFFRPALIEIRKMCYEISHRCFFHFDEKHTYTLQEFRDTQFEHLQKALNDIKELNDLIKELIKCAFDSELAPKYHRWPDGELQERKLTDKKRCFQYNRIVCFIRLVDYLFGSTLHSLVVKAAATFLAVLQDKLCQAPSNPTVASTQDSNEESEFSSQDQPMFISELILVTDAFIYKSSEEEVQSATDALIYKPAEEDFQSATDALIYKSAEEDVQSATGFLYKPSEKDFQETILEIFRQLTRTITSFEIFSEYPDFSSVTQSNYIEVQSEIDRTKVLPLREFVISADDHLQTIIKDIKATFQNVFKEAEVYSRKMEHFRLSYEENRRVDLDAIRHQDHDLPFLKNVLKSYYSQHTEAMAIQPKVQVGLLLLDQTQLKKELVSSTLCCVEAINEALPQLARRKLDTLIAKSCEAQLQLELPPNSTADLANSLIFLREIQEWITGLEMDQETVCQMYHLVNKYSIPTPPEDLVVFNTLQSHINSVHNAIDYALTERDANLQTFSASLNKDIKELDNEVMKIYLKLQDPQILEINSDSSQVHLLMEEIRLSIDSMQAQVSTYTSYQQKLNLEVTKFKYLEDLTEEFRLKQLLLNSTERWDILQDEWQKSTLQELDLKQFITQVNAYNTYINQLEKGLPSNDMLRCLKEKVEAMTERLPVITDLHILRKSTEHWTILLKPILWTLSTDDELTVAELEMLNAFSHGTEIHEVTEQAIGQDSINAIMAQITKHSNDVDQDVDDATSSPMTET